VLFHVVESTYNPLTVTAEVASSSLVVPAILSKRVTRRDTGNSYPQSHPQSVLDAPRFGVEKLLLSRNRLVEVFARVQVSRPLHSRTPGDSRRRLWVLLNRFGLYFRRLCLYHKALS
jgi:hypothetical protein